MPEVTESSIVDALLGTRMIGAVMAGNRKIYVRFAKYSYWTPGVFTFTLPDWASGYGLVLSGGGGGGQAGNGGNGNGGRGGQGGIVSGVWGKMVTTAGKTMSLTIGVGGAGGTSSHAYGQTGGTTTVITHAGNTYTALGGPGNPTVSTRDGGLRSHTFSAHFSEFVKIPAGSPYPNGPAGTGNGGVGKRGGGGAGGNGGFFNSYGRGGKGGDGFVDIYVWGMPPDEMTGRDTELITLGTDFQARDQFRDMLTNRGLDYRTVAEIPFDIEFVGSGSTSHMFHNCLALKSVPEMNTSSVTTMTGMFRGCSSITTTPPMDTSSVTTMNYMFQGCGALKSVAEMDTSSVTNMTSMFEGCAELTHVPDMVANNVAYTNFMFNACGALTDGKVRLIGKHPNVATAGMIDNSGLTRLPFYNAAGNPI